VKTKTPKAAKTHKKPVAPAKPTAVPPPVAKKAAKPEKPGAPAAKPVVPGKPGAPGTAPAGGAMPPAATGKAAGRKGRKGGHRREMDFAVGELLLPGGAQTVEEALYMLRGAVASERGPAGEAAIEEIVSKRPNADPAHERTDLNKHLAAVVKRFDHSAIEASLPPRPQGGRRTFVSVIERARYRRREMGAFMRGLDLGRTETSHMDSHGEASLQSLMEWAARLENLVESEEPENADYAMFHRGLDQLENTTEALIIDVEQTLRRLRDKKRAAQER
jgi:hypothetical protein